VSLLVNEYTFHKEYGGYFIVIGYGTLSSFILLIMIAVMLLSILLYLVKVFIKDIVYIVLPFECSIVRHENRKV
jgi:hypothetical protein